MPNLKELRDDPNSLFRVGDQFKYTKNKIRQQTAQLLPEITSDKYKNNINSLELILINIDNTLIQLGSALPSWQENTKKYINSIASNSDPSTQLKYIKDFSNFDEPEEDEIEGAGIAMRLKHKKFKKMRGGAITSDEEGSDVEIVLNPDLIPKPEEENLFVFPEEAFVFDPNFIPEEETKEEKEKEEEKEEEYLFGPDTTLEKGEQDPDELIAEYKQNKSLLNKLQKRKKLTQDEKYQLEYINLRLETIKTELIDLGYRHTTNRGWIKPKEEKPKEKTSKKKQIKEAQPITEKEVIETIDDLNDPEINIKDKAELTQKLLFKISPNLRSVKVDRNEVLFLGGKVILYLTEANNLFKTINKQITHYKQNDLEEIKNKVDDIDQFFEKDIKDYKSVFNYLEGSKGSSKIYNSMESLLYKLVENAQIAYKQNTSPGIQRIL